MQQLPDIMAKLGFRKAAANLGWLMAERGVRFGLSVVVGFFVARHLGPTRLGELSYCMALITLVGCVPALGLDAVVKRDLLQSPAKTAELLASSSVLRLAGGLLCYAVLLVVVLAIDGA